MTGSAVQHISILLVDDHPIVRQGYRRVLDHQSDFRVVAEPDEAQIGTVHEEWATESRPGDVFLLGTHSWRIRRVEPGTVRVVDAHGAPPSVPHWQGEAPGRTRELSQEVSALREEICFRVGGAYESRTDWHTRLAPEAA